MIAKKKEKEEKEKWMELCEIAANEQDPNKLMALVAEIDRLLGMKQSIFCRICGEPVSLKADTVADEDGKAVHEECYVKRKITPDAGQEAS
jgi:hypothetical protein